MAEFVSKEVDLSLLDDVLEKYGTIKGSLITILQNTQEIYGYIPMDAVYRISEAIGETPAKIIGVATFYAQFRFEPIGKYHIMMCKGTACYVNGAMSIADAIYEEAGIRDKQTSKDGLFTLEIVACLGCCSLAPVMMINGKTYAKLTPSKVKEILSGLREEAKCD